METIKRINAEIIDYKKETGKSVKEVSDSHHTFGDLYTRDMVLFRCLSAFCPKLCFRTLKHYDEENDPISNFNGDFMVGIYTPLGPASFHFKLEYFDDFSHIEIQDHGPEYEGYTEEEKNERINYITYLVNAGLTQDDILSMIMNNSDLDDSLKPIPKKYKEKTIQNQT